MTNYLIPFYIQNAGIDTPVLRYLWDDTDIFSKFQYNPESLLEKVESVSLRGKAVLAIGIYEWIIWRYNKVSDDPMPFQILETAWWSSVNNKYSQYIELPGADYLGPARRPLFAAAHWMVPIIYPFPEISNDWLFPRHIALLSQLAMHVLPETKLFEHWLDIVANRLAKFHPAPENDPFEDLFNDHEEERRGSLVAREALDPSFDYHPDQAPELLDNFLRSVDQTANPFLRSPEELKESGIEHPYRVFPPESPEWWK